MIGIIGGIGPAAGVDLMEKIIDADEGKLDGQRAPVLLYSDPRKIPSRNDFLLGRSDLNPGVEIAEIIEEIEGLGVKMAAIACNAAHAAPVFSKARQSLEASKSRVKLIHLVELLADKIASEGKTRKIGVLSVEGTYRSGVYRDSFERVGIDAVSLPDELVALMHDVIWNPEYGVKAFSDPPTGRAKDNAERVMDHLVDDGADAVILGCTEYPLLVRDDSYRGVRVIDANRYFGRIILEEYEKI